MALLMRAGLGGACAETNVRSNAATKTVSRGILIHSSWSDVWRIMSDEQVFRTILVVSALLLFPVSIYHRVKSQSTRERLDRWQEGYFILFTLRPIGIAT